MTPNKTWIGAAAVAAWLAVYSSASFAHGKEAHADKPLTPDCARVLQASADLTDPVQIALRLRCERMASGRDADHSPRAGVNGRMHSSADDSH